MEQYGSAGEEYDLERFGLRQMIEAGRTLRGLGVNCVCMEEAAREIAGFFFERFRDGESGEPACALVRCFKTHRLGELPLDLREAALTNLRGAQPDEATMCLTLLASRGMMPEWNARHHSKEHRAIPLATVGMMERAPMIARMVEQMGLPTHEMLFPAAAGEPEQGREEFNVFHVEHAPGSPFVPAQAEFVVPHGVRSVLGFGGMLPCGSSFFVLLFSRVPVAGDTAKLFRTLALGVKLVLLEHTFGRIFCE